MMIKVLKILSNACWKINFLLPLEPSPSENDELGQDCKRCRCKRGGQVSALSSSNALIFSSVSDLFSSFWLFLARVWLIFNILAFPGACPTLFHSSVTSSPNTFSHSSPHTISLTSSILQMLGFIRSPDIHLYSLAHQSFLFYVICEWFFNRSAVARVHLDWLNSS